MMDNGYFQKIEDEFLAGTYQKIPVLAARAPGAIDMKSFRNAALAGL